MDENIKWHRMCENTSVFHKKTFLSPFVLLSFHGSKFLPACLFDITIPTTGGATTSSSE